jgi:hypothetical protein
LLFLSYPFARKQRSARAKMLMKHPILSVPSPKKEGASTANEVAQPDASPCPPKPDATCTFSDKGHIFSYKAHKFSDKAHNFPDKGCNFFGGDIAVSSGGI